MYYETKEMENRSVFFMEHIIARQQFDEERSLYNLKNTLVEDCRFEGPADGESVLKEARNIHVKD